jgi:hypothetical protein
VGTICAKCLVIVKRGVSRVQGGDRMHKAYEAVYEQHLINGWLVSTKEIYILCVRCGVKHYVLGTR